MGLSIQCFGLAGLLIAAHFSTQPQKWSTKTKFTQAYYYAIFSSALSFTTLLSVVLHGLGVIRKYYAKQTKWDTNQRALFRQSISLTLYLLIGSVIFARIEGWAFLDALFWAEFTLLTIGLGGEFTTKTTLGRTLLLPYAILGMVLVALLVISVRKLMKGGRLHFTNQLTERYLKQLRETLTRDGGPVYPMSNEYTFNLIRRIGPKAEKRCSRIALSISVTATLIILLGGAAIFEIAEADQGWTYGTSCYFAYISLLTIGYGDYVPTSEAGKSFFVVWSLLAVPILTIVI
ncbi:voltage-gated potassium channel, partial [Bimuria novae-zelandiae CBS 107.79]